MCIRDSRVASRLDSRIVLDRNGAEVLMGQGDMLFLPPGSAKLIRAQGTYVEERELRRVIDYLRRYSEQQFDEELEEITTGQPAELGPRDELFDQAVEILLATRRGSVSLLQRRLGIGYARAARIIDQLAAEGIVGPPRGSQPREILITPEQWAARKAGQSPDDSPAEPAAQAGSAEPDQPDGQSAGPASRTGEDNQHRPQDGQQDRS